MNTEDRYLLFILIIHAITLRYPDDFLKQAASFAFVLIIYLMFLMRRLRQENE